MAAVAVALPNFRLDDSDGAYTWHGIIDTGRGCFRIRVEGESERGMPMIVPIRPRALGRNEGQRGFRKSEHLYRNGNLCVADVVDWDPRAHTTATAIAWGAHWLAAYTDWRLGGPWPTEGYRPHAVA
jgi:hypothetical protein